MGLLHLGCNKEVAALLSQQNFFPPLNDLDCPQGRSVWGDPPYEFLYEAPATPYPLQDLRFKREALSAMVAFKDMTANNDGWVVEKNEVSE